MIQKRVFYPFFDPFALFGLPIRILNDISTLFKQKMQLCGVNSSKKLFLCQYYYITYYNTIYYEIFQIVNRRDGNHL
jgi:hypothetical protein